MLKGKNAIITGASRGIGKAIALKLAQEGVNTAILFRGSEESAVQTVTEALSFGITAKCYRCNVASEDECSHAVETILKDFGSVDILVNNAGITRDKLLLRMNEQDFTDVIDTNLRGAYHMIRYCCRSFIKQKYGKIINIASVAGLTGNAGQTNYAASKAGLIGLTKSVAKELAGKQICCNAIAPGFIETDMTSAFSGQEERLNAIPAKRFGTPKEVANLAAFLADDCSDYITGEVIRIDGGLAM